MSQSSITFIEKTKIDISIQWVCLIPKILVDVGYNITLVINDLIGGYFTISNSSEGTISVWNKCEI